MLFNNCRSRPHAQLYGVGAFYDLNKHGRQARMASDLRPGQHCCVATPAEGENIEFAWYRLSHERDMPDPDDPSSMLRVFFGEWLGSHTLTRAEAIATHPYAQFFNVNGHFKQLSAIELDCVAPLSLQRN
jgi:hypothetical protein